MNIYFICSVRGADTRLQGLILQYAEKLERQGHTVRVPFRNTDQSDPIGINITQEHELKDILWAERIIIFWNPLSEGSWYDLAQVRMEQQFRKLEIIFFDPQSLIIDSQKPIQLSDPAKLPENQIPQAILIDHELELLRLRSITIEWTMDPTDLTRVNKICLWMLAQARIMAHHYPNFTIRISNIKDLRPTSQKSYTNVALCTHHGLIAPLTAEEFRNKLGHTELFD